MLRACDLLGVRGRQAEIAVAVMQLIPRKAMGDGLGIKNGTVRTHVTRLFKAVRVHSEPAFVLRVLEAWRRPAR